ncbi:MAG: hypothetical protein PVG06_13840 [Desulfobacterales bacterium]
MKKITKKIWLTTAILLLVATIAGADEVDQALSDVAPQAVVQSTRELIESGLASDRAIALTRAMVQHRFGAQQIEEAHRVLQKARNQNLPSDPIINKAFEGMAKGVQASRIVGAMDAVRERYDFAHRQALQLTGRKSHLNQMGHIIAAGLAAGLTPHSVESIISGLQERSRTMNTDQREALALETFKTARDMARLGVSPSQIAPLLGQALRHQFSASQMHNLRTAFRNGSRKSDPRSLAVQYGRSIEQGKSFEGPGGGNAGEGAGSTGGAGSGPGGSEGDGSDGSGPGGGNGRGGSGG